MGHPPNESLRTRGIARDQDKIQDASPPILRDGRAAGGTHEIGRLWGRIHPLVLSQRTHRFVPIFGRGQSLRQPAHPGRLVGREGVHDAGRATERRARLRYAAPAQPVAKIGRFRDVGRVGGSLAILAVAYLHVSRDAGRAQCAAALRRAGGMSQIVRVLHVPPLLCRIAPTQPRLHGESRRVRVLHGGTVRHDRGHRAVRLRGGDLSPRQVSDPPALHALSGNGQRPRGRAERFGRPRARPGEWRVEQYHLPDEGGKRLVRSGGARDETIRAKR
ncbi:uncharacterized protein LOC110854638 [Folsomia candida]|uniref:uncharacterized protein LOC110854638 n=1 Tax=Folsomia candida TaxID=158441 RepID=UPI000B903FBD|nr:uncharacterized protein LOC110854638 [Folsomia candida]